ncbi:MAG: MtrB/PioB family outer membrane beta-barrel protein, partial [Syntrophales bacterium]|nr:MtrB/PioB family outer membrane beta-barrel protein [Syntrophales bacterium]
MSYLYSHFDNGEGFQNFRNPATTNTAATTDTLYLPPGNNYQKLDFQGGIKLPMQSRLNVDVSSSRAESSALLGTSYVSNVAGGRTNIGVSSPYFDGKVNTDNYNFSLTSNPLSFLNTKLFYKYYNKSDVSSSITTTDGATVLLNDLFGYRKNTYGAEMGFKLPGSLRLTTAYTFIKTERQRDDLPKNRDNFIDVGLKWSGLKFMNVKVGYDRLDRAAEFAVSENPAVDLEPWIRRFDAAARVRDTFKASVEVFPRDTMSFGVGYKHKMTKYSDTILGLTDMKVDQFNFDADWQAHSRLRFFGYSDIEQRVLNQLQRQTTGVLDPATAPTSTNFNWTASQTENTYGYGLGSEIAIIPDKLKLTLSHNSVRSDGTVDYTYLLGNVALPAGRNQDNIDLNARDTYRLNNYAVKATYQMTKAVALSASYVYEDFTYDDNQYSGYQYFVPVTQGGYLTGAYANPSYRVHVVFLGLNIKL